MVRATTTAAGVNQVGGGFVSRIKSVPRRQITETFLLNAVSSLVLAGPNEANRYAV
jgi:hypothetical protein